MQAIKLSKKYPEFKQEEIFDLINKFQYVFSDCSAPYAFYSATWRRLQLGLTLQTNRCRR